MEEKKETRFITMWRNCLNPFHNKTVESTVHNIWKRERGECGRWSLGYGGVAPKEQHEHVNTNCAALRPDIHATTMINHSTKLKCGQQYSSGKIGMKSCDVCPDSKKSGISVTLLLLQLSKSNGY
jgi:hypothetical protein